MGSTDCIAAILQPHWHHTICMHHPRLKAAATGRPHT
jgi:hypothetical protein